MFPQDFLGIAPHIDQQLFFTGGANWQVWEKPEGKCFAWMICIGGAGGGGGGASNGSTGGSGGGGGGLSRLFLPLWMLPDILYVQVGAGGSGGAATVTGTSGARSFISLQPNSTAANCYLASGHVAAAGGTGGGNGAVAESIATTADCILASNGDFLAIAGVAGANPGTDITALATKPLTGGAGGGNSSISAGNKIIGAGLIPTINGGATGTNPGRSGITLWPGGLTGFMACGGTGGGGAGAPTGGAGGNGGLGSGGGGGGVSSTLGGAGGKGGDGLVAIWSI